MNELIYCPFCGLETHVLVGEFGCSYFGCIKDKSCYGYAMKHCVNDDKLEAEIAAWNRRAPESAVESLLKQKKIKPPIDSKWAQMVDDMRRGVLRFDPTLAEVFSGMRSGRIVVDNQEKTKPEPEPEPAPVEWQAETQEFVINGCQVIVRTQWKECDDHGLEVAVMLESDRAAHGCDSIKIGLQFPKSLFIGELLHAIWGFKVQEPVSGKTFRKVTVKFTGSLNKAKASAKIYVQESVRGRLEQIVRFDMLQKL